MVKSTLYFIILMFMHLSARDRHRGARWGWGDGGGAQQGGMWASADSREADNAGLWRPLTGWLAW